MAVPGADDGPLTPDTTPTASLAPTLVAAVSAVVVLACLVVLGVRWADTSGSFGDRVSEVFGGDPAQEAAREDARLRDLVMSQASLFVVRVNTYGPADLEDDNTMPGYVEKVEEVITPRFAVDFEKSVPLAASSVARIQVERTADVYATGAESIGSDNAAVLVTGAINQSYVQAGQDGRVEVEPETFRIRVQLVRTGGSWLVDDFAAVEGETTDPTDPTTPTDPTDPSPGATEGPGAGTTLSPEVERYAEIVANRRVPIDAAVALLDSCGFPRVAAGAECRTAPQRLGEAARVLVNSLRAAANPESNVFVSEPPPEIADLVTATEGAGINVLNALGALPASCVTTASATCARQRQVLAGTQDTLLSALSAWGTL